MFSFCLVNIIIDNNLLYGNRKIRRGISVYPLDEVSMVEKIRKHAKEKGLSIARLEASVGLSNGAIGKWDKSSPRVANLKKVADFLKVSIEELL